MQTVVLENIFENSEIINDQAVFGKKVGFFGKLFGCWHENLSRPFGQSSTAYRTCLECGARKHFNPETLKTYGSFHYPPIIREMK